MRFHELILVSLLAGLLAGSLAPARLAAATVPALERVLVFTRTAGFTHGSISDGVALVEALGTEGGFAVEISDQLSAIESTNLSRFDVVVFMSTTGDFLDGAAESALRAYVEGGGGWVGVHAAADAEYGWPWYGTLLGGDAWFEAHPSIQDAQVAIELEAAPSTDCLDVSFTFREEWYNFETNPRPSVEVLLTLDESSYNPGSGAMGDDHPIAWRHPVGSGRSWYTALGHRSETYADPRFREHLRGGIAWAAGADFADGFESGDLCRWSDIVRGTTSQLWLHQDFARREQATPRPPVHGVISSP